jgi:hypothetical protein
VTRDQLQDWLQLLGMAGVIASLLFVGAQVNQADQIANFEGAGTTASQDVEYFIFLAENSGVMHRGCLGEELSPDDESKFASLYRAWLLRNYWRWHQDNMRELGAGSQDAVNRFAAGLHRYPGLLRVHNKYLNWRINVGVDSESTFLFINSVEKRRNELAAIEPNPDYDAAFCGG